MKNKDKGSNGAPTIAKTVLAVPRAWLIALSMLVVAPWLIVAGIYIRHLREAAALPEQPDAEAAASTSALAGPWGQLTITEILISPPIEYLADDWGRPEVSDDWHFPGVSFEMLEAFLSSSGMTREEAERVRSNARSDSKIGGLVVKPDPELIRTMNPQVRARLYLQLAKSALNFDQANAFRFFGSSSDEWLRSSLISPGTRRLVEPMIYRDGDYLLFSDVKFIRSRIRDAEERRRLAKVLLRQATMLVRLTVPDSSKVAALADYWGTGGRRTDLRPLLESVVGSGRDGSIDIIHLLPTFARNHLYRFPKISTADLNKPLLANCMWTALNFFNAQPDDRFLDIDVALKTLEQDYYVVKTDFRLGDIVAFLNKDGDLFHVAVYLADGLVFSKNGTSPMAPWAITTIDRLKGFYRARSADPNLIYHRRNDF